MNRSSLFEAEHRITSRFPGRTFLYLRISRTSSIFGFEERTTPPPSIFETEERRTLHLQSSIFELRRTSKPPPSSIFGPEDPSEDRTEDGGASSKLGGASSEMADGILRFSGSGARVSIREYKISVWDLTDMI